jgi:hypothetical protein
MNQDLQQSCEFSDKMGDPMTPSTRRDIGVDQSHQTLNISSMNPTELTPLKISYLPMSLIHPVSIAAEAAHEDLSRPYSQTPRTTM